MEINDIYSAKNWYYDKNMIHIKNFDKYKKYGKFFVVTYSGYYYLLFFDKIDHYLVDYDDIEKILEEKFKTEIINDIRKEKIKQLDMLHNI